MKTIAEQISVMEAYQGGKTIQKSFYGINDYRDVSNPKWNWAEYDYRVKPESKIRPYANAEEFLKAMKEHGPFFTSDGDVYRLAFTVFNDRINYDNTWCSYDKLELDYKWQDGTPCGIEEGGNV